MPTQAPAGRLPSLLASLSFALPGGDAYQPQNVAFDEAGRAVVLCYSHGQPESATSALVVLDPSLRNRGPVMPLPGRSLGPLAVAAGRAYVAYEDEQYRSRLTALSLDTGRVLADVPIDFISSVGTLAVDRSGRLYLAQTGQLEVRDGVTLQPMRSLPLAVPGGRALALDAAHNRLFLSTGQQVLALRTPDLKLLWQGVGPGAEGPHLVLDRTGERLYAYADSSRGQPGGILVYDATTGLPLPPPAPPQGSEWQFVAADSGANRLLFTEPQAQETRLWQTDLAGHPAGSQATVEGYAQTCAGPGGRVAVLLTQSHILRALDPADLHTLGDTPLGIELRHLVVDSAHGRVYVDDSAGRLHVLDSESDRPLSTLPAGSGPLALDAPNGLLLVARSEGSREMAVVDTNALTVTAVLTGGAQAAIDSAGHRAFLGYTETSPAGAKGEVQVWDTRTFQRLGAIPQRGEPTYNPLRNEIYLRDYTAYVVDGRTLQVKGELTPDIGAEPMRYCNGCTAVAGISVDPQQDVIAVNLMQFSAGKGAGTVPQPRLFSAHTLQPVTGTVTVLLRGTQGADMPFLLPPAGGRTYIAERYARYVFYTGVVAQRAGSAEALDYREGLSLDLYLPGTGVALSEQRPFFLAYDLQTWQPLGWLPWENIQAIDLSGRRLYAWQGPELRILSFDGGQPLPAAAPERWPLTRKLPPIEEIALSPDFAHDRTVFVVATGGILRSTDGGASWVRLQGGLPPEILWGKPSYHLAISPDYAYDHTLFVGGRVGDSFGLGVWRSTDGGETWQPVWQGLRHLKVDRLAISPDYARDHTLLAYCAYDLFWQGDAGASLFRSQDGGETWQQAALASRVSGNATLPPPEALLPMPPQPVQFQVTSEGDLSRSADGGHSWQVVLSGEPGNAPLAVLLSPLFSQDGQVFALYRDRLLRSTDGGQTWGEATDRHLVRADYPQYFTAMAVGLLRSGRPVVLVGDGQGLLLPLDPTILHWSPLEPPAPTATPQATGVPGPTATLLLTDTLAPTAGASPQPTSTPAAQPAGTPTPCPGAAAPFQAAYGRWSGRLGCPTSQGLAPMALQRFEHGWLLWRGDTKEIYALTSNGASGTWAVYPDTWREGQPESDPALQPPKGRLQPVRGFGLVWRTQLGGPQAGIGWALEPEQGYSGAWQAFNGGLLIAAPQGRVFALFINGCWEQ